MSEKEVEESDTEKKERWSVRETQEVGGWEGGGWLCRGEGAVTGEDVAEKTQAVETGGGGGGT